MAFENSGLEVLVQSSLALSGKRATLGSRDAGDVDVCAERARPVSGAEGDLASMRDRRRLAAQGRIELQPTG
jgi:hypothetical protein